MNIFLQILIGFFIADIMGGILHWGEDTYLDYCIDVPILSGIAKDNELHHYFPRSMLAYSYFEHMTVSLPVTLSILLILYFTNKSILVKYPYLFLSFAFFSILSNIFHRFSHMRNCENHYIISFLQQTGILCSHEHHSMHHKNIDQKYCVISEYNNYLLDSIHFWRCLEYMILLLTGIEPSRKKSMNDYRSIHNHMHENAKLECPDTPTKEDVDDLIAKLERYYHCTKN